MRSADHWSEVWCHLFQSAHRWAHFPADQLPVWITALQGGLVLSHERHMEHHQDTGKQFTILSGQMDWILDAFVKLMPAQYYDYWYDGVGALEAEPWEHRGTDSAVVEVTFGVKRSQSAFSQCLQKAAAMAHGVPWRPIVSRGVPWCPDHQSAVHPMRSQASGLQFVTSCDTERRVRHFQVRLVTAQRHHDPIHSPKTSKDIQRHPNMTQRAFYIDTLHVPRLSSHRMSIAAVSGLSVVTR
eukprot:Skav207001  [mRNA]  locus=scaffold1299:78899:80498:- [translate_table: standard]